LQTSGKGGFGLRTKKTNPLPYNTGKGFITELAKISIYLVITENES